MSWFLKLHATYETCAKNSRFTESSTDKNRKEIPGLMPISHTSQQVHIHVVLDAEGNFMRAALLPPKTQMIIPATEDSAGRTANLTPHPLIDKIHYCAKDYTGTKENLFAAYHAQLKKWCDSNHSHPKVRVVLAYVSKGTLVQDLLKEGILYADTATNTLLTEVPDGLKDSIFSLLVAKKGVRDQGDALVAWSVVTADDKEPSTWKDQTLQRAWMDFDANQMEQQSLCMVQGKRATVTVKHPRNIRRPGDGAKLISANDNDGFTFRGRFLDAVESCTIGYEASHKVHNALRWLLARQGYRNGEQVVLAWAENGVELPKPCENWLPVDEVDFDAEDDAQSPASEEQNIKEHLDIGEAFSKRLRKAIRGYKAELADTGSIAILALDAASPGRLSVTFYREQMPEQYLGNLEKWQQDCAWVLPVKVTVKDDKDKDKEIRKFFVCAPTPDTIARVAYGRRIDDTLLKSTVERLLPCIVDATPLPRDLVECCVRRACNRPGLESWEWPEVLGTACAVYKGYFARHPKEEERRTYDMALDTTCRSRDYLYGRLLAVAEYVERTALDRANEKRPTNAERLIQRFADHPCATWRQIYLQLDPYLQRLQGSEKFGWLPTKAKRLMQEVCDIFEHDDFNATRKLSGEFLLGYHCQMSDFYKKRDTKNTPDDTDTTLEEGE